MPYPYLSFTDVSSAVVRQVCLLHVLTSFGMNVSTTGDLINITYLRIPSFRHLYIQLGCMAKNSSTEPEVFPAPIHDNTL